MMKQFLSLIIVCLLVPVTILGCANDLKPGTTKKTPRIKTKDNTTKIIYSNKPQAQIDFDEYSIVFAFSNTSGDNILAISDTLPDPGLYTHTISAEGRIVPITYKEKKTGDENKDFQQVYSNFSNCGGYLFLTGQNKVDYRKVNVLMTDDFLKGRKYISDLKPEKKQIEKSILDTLQSQRGRKIKNSFPIVKIDNKGSLYAVNYELSNDSAMFSFVFVSPGGLVVKDNFGEYDPGGTWRVGDKGYVKPEMFDVLAAFESKYGVEFAIDWKGSEGDYIEYLIENGSTLEAVKNEYRYTLPN